MACYNSTNKTKNSGIAERRSIFGLAVLCNAFAEVVALGFLNPRLLASRLRTWMSLDRQCSTLFCQFGSDRQSWLCRRKIRSERENDRSAQTRRELCHRDDPFIAVEAYHS